MRGNEKRVCLNRLLSLRNNKIEKDCPTFVIGFLARSLSIDLSSYPHWNTEEEVTKKIIRTIEGTAYEESLFIDVDDFDKNLREIASFVNPDCSEWSDRDILYEAFWDAYKFSPRVPLSAVGKFGYKTPDLPHNIDPIMAYQICLRYEIPTNRKMFLKDMENEILFLSTKLTPIREDLFSRVTRLSRRGLIGLRNHLTKSSISSQTLYPTTKEEAVQRAAEEYRWDISLSACPSKEFTEMDKCSNDSYQPVDLIFRRFFNINRYFFHLDHRYIKHFDHIYDEKLKKTLIYRNGDSTDSDYLITGVHPKLFMNNRLTDRDLFTTIEYISVPLQQAARVKRILSSPDFICEREELGRYWEMMGSFVFPHDRSKEFSEHHLQMIIRTSNNGDPLIIVINKIKSERTKIIDDGFFNLFHLGRDKAIHLLKEILDLGFKMRGYGVCYTEPPLKESSYDLGEYQEKIEKNVVEKAFELKEKYENALSKIPLMTGRNEVNKEHLKINTYGEEMTVGKIISLIFQTQEVTSCIRTNSNYLLVTAWYFLTRLRVESFPIEDMKFIF